jgi:ABC-type Na+ efflux pump permease subunit
MNFLPIVGRELRVAARRRGTYWMRFSVALLGIGLCAWTLLTMGRFLDPQRVGQQVFYVLSGLAFLYCLFAGTQTTADCLSAEKREGTLGLLFLTDLKGYDIVAGKIAATSLNAVYALLAILPVMALPLLLGGVSAGGFWRVALALVNTLFVSLAAGMFVSSVTRLERSAVVGTVGLILLVVGGLPVCLAIWSGALNEPTPDEIARLILFTSPGYAFGLAWESTALPRVNSDFWWSSLVVHGIGWLFLWLAVRIVPRSWTDRAVTTSPRNWRAWLSRWRYGGAAQRKSLREQLLSVNPITWLSARNRQPQRNVWIALAVIAAGWVWGFAKLGQEWLYAPVAITFAIALHTVLKYAASGEACRRFAEDREIGSLELLLSTPLAVTDILRGQLLALRRAFAGPIVVVLLADLLLLTGAIGPGAAATFSSSRQEVNQLIMAFIAGVVVFLADLVTLSWLGMWLGLRETGYTRAWGRALGLVLLLPWCVFIAMIFTVEALSQWRSGPSFEAVLLWWVFLALANDAIFFGWSRMRLRERLRDEAARRFQPGASRRWWWPFRAGASD